MLRYRIVIYIILNSIVVFIINFDCMDYVRANIEDFTATTSINYSSSTYHTLIWCKSYKHELVVQEQSQICCLNLIKVNKTYKNSMNFWSQTDKNPSRRS